MNENEEKIVKLKFYPYELTFIQEGRFLWPGDLSTWAALMLSFTLWAIVIGAIAFAIGH